MYCNKCGNELKEDMIYCNKCGNKVVTNIENQSNSVNTVNNSNEVKTKENKIKDKSIDVATTKTILGNITIVLAFINITIFIYFLFSTYEISTIFITMTISISISILIRMCQKNKNAKIISNLKERKSKIIEELKNKGFNSSFVLLTLDNIGILVDENNKKIAICNELNVQPQIFNFEDIESSELIENGNQQIEGNSLVTYAAGQVFGTNAAIASANRARNIDSFCTSLYILVHTKNFETDNSQIELIKGRVNKVAEEYIKMYNFAKETVISVEKIANINKEENANEISENTNNEIKGESNSIADEIKKFKELFDIGAITAEEYEKKKKELLNK